MRLALYSDYAKREGFIPLFQSLINRVTRLGGARSQWFSPILAGATLRDRLFGCLGAMIGIGITGLLCGVAGGQPLHMLLLVPPMGASAVLLFAVPSSPMAQPWPTIGGNAISALVGIVVGHNISEPALAAGVAAGAAIGAMSLLRCLHPPGGAAALVAVFAGSSAGYWFPLTPVALNAIVLVSSAWLYHKLSGHSYPHVARVDAPSQAASVAPSFSEQDIEATLEELGETFDIGLEDLSRLLRAVEARALTRPYHNLTCAEIMTPLVIATSRSAQPEAVRALLVKHDCCAFPVLDDEGRIVGTVGLRELLRPAAHVQEVMLSPSTATAARPAHELIHLFAHGGVRAVFVIDERQRPIGAITEANWISVLTRGLDIGSISPAEFDIGKSDVARHVERDRQARRVG